MTHQLNSALLSIGVKSTGAELCSIKSNKTGTEYLWQADPSQWARHAPILFPIVGKLKDDTYYVDGIAYHLPQHGFARDQTFALTQATPDQLVFELRSSSELRAVYPFDFILSVTYTLAGNELNVRYSVKNTGGSVLLYSIGAHPAFRIPVHAGARRSDYELRFERNESTAIHLIEGGLLSGEKRSFSPENNKLPIADSLFDNDALVFKNLNSKKISLAKKNELPFLSFHFDAPFFGIWSKSRTSEFVCLEPWQGVADSTQHNQQLNDKEGVVKLATGHSRDFSFTIAIVD